MQVNTCIREIIAARGVSLRSVSADLGKRPTWTANVAQPTRSPALATVADVADVLGYRLAVVDASTGEAVGTIEPPRRAGTEGPSPVDEARG